MVQLVGTVEHPETVIRLRVGYRSVQSLVKEYTASLGRGGCLLVTRRAVAPGARFVFEMSCDEFGDSLVVEGEVVRVRPVNATCEAYELAVRYRSAPSTRAALDVLLASIEVDTSYPVVREAPRIPVNLVADDSVGNVRYVVRDVSRGGARIECSIGSCQVAPNDRVLLGVHPATGPKVFIGSTVRWSTRSASGGEQQFGVQFDAVHAAEDPRRQAIESLVQLEPPAQLLVHVVDLKSRQSNRLRGARELRRVELAEVRSAVGQLVQRDLLERYNLVVVDSSIDALLEEVSCVARVGLEGDLSGELRMHANPPLCAAVASQITGEAEPEADSDALYDALRELAVRLAGALCDGLERAGFDVAATPPLLDEPSSARQVAWVHNIALAGGAGLATLKIVAYESPRAATAHSHHESASSLFVK